jgi:hypothetical protein
MWPSFDMASEKRRLELNEEISFPYGSPSMIKRSLEIESFDFNTLDRISTRTNISFYCILTFDVTFGDDSESIALSGREMDGKADPDEYKEWMNVNLKIK